MAGLYPNTFRLKRAPDGYKRSGDKMGAGLPPPDNEGVVLLAEANFSTNTYSPGFDISQVFRTTNAPPPGETHCARVNSRTGATDPIIGSANPLALSTTATPKYQGSALANANPTVRTIISRYRFDDYEVRNSQGRYMVGGDYNNNDDATLGPAPAGYKFVKVKGGWYGPTEVNGNTDWTQTGFYTVLAGGPLGLVRFGDNADNGDQRGDKVNGVAWYNHYAWSNKNRYGGFSSSGAGSLFYLQSDVEFGSDGDWIEQAMVIDSAHEEYNVVQLYIRKTPQDLWSPCYRPTYAPLSDEARIYVPKTWNVEKFSCIYSTNSDVSGTVARTGTPNAVQLGNIQIYSGRAI